MNLFHRWYCNSDGWAKSMREYMPFMLQDIDLGDHMLEIGPGPGVVTELLRERVPKLTSIEIDHKLAESLKTRMAGTNVTIVEGDGTAMAFANSTFSSAVSFTMLHHVPSESLQDNLLEEACRVLRPGAVFTGSDSVPSFRWNLYHLFDTRVPVEPDSFDGRLSRAGFVDVSVRRFPGGFSFRARKP